MITKTQFEKMQRDFIDRKCPICRHSAFKFYEDKTNMLNEIPSDIMQPYSEVDISNTTYISVECNNCGYIMNFNIKKIIR